MYLYLSIFGKSHTDERMDEKTPAGSVNLLDDTLLESPSFARVDKTAQSLHTDPSKADDADFEYQGFVRRKTIAKDSKKNPFPSSWQRFWLQISGNVLVFFASKSFKGTNRSDFRMERCKVLPLDGWQALRADTDAADAFQLVNRTSGTIYKFKTGSEDAARQWVSQIESVTNKAVKPLPANLMSFE